MNWISIFVLVGIISFNLAAIAPKKELKNKDEPGQPEQSLPEQPQRPEQQDQHEHMEQPEQGKIISFTYNSP